MQATGKKALQRLVAGWLGLLLLCLHLLAPSAHAHWHAQHLTEASATGSLLSPPTAEGDLCQLFTQPATIAPSLPQLPFSLPPLALAPLAAKPHTSPPLVVLRRGPPRAPPSVA